MEVLFGAEEAFDLAINCYDAARTGCLELNLGIMWNCVESSKHGTSEQCMIATSKGYDIEDQFFIAEVVGRAEDNFQCY